MLEALHVPTRGRTHKITCWLPFFLSLDELRWRTKKEQSTVTQILHWNKLQLFHSAKKKICMEICWISSPSKDVNTSSSISLLIKPPFDYSVTKYTCWRFNSIKTRWPHSLAVFSISCVTSLKKELRRSGLKDKWPHSHSRAHKFSWDRKVRRSQTSTVKGPEFLLLSIGWHCFSSRYKGKYQLVGKQEVTSQGPRNRITLNVLSTGRAGLKVELRILNPNAPVTNSSRAWSGYTY